LIQTVMEAIDVVERIVKYYIPEPEYLEERRRLIGEERRRQAEGEWQELNEQVRAEMEKDTDPASGCSYSPRLDGLGPRVHGRLSPDREIRRCDVVAGEDDSWNRHPLSAMLNLQKGWR
jgi:hypothetical protein